MQTRLGLLAYMCCTFKVYVTVGAKMELSSSYSIQLWLATYMHILTWLVTQLCVFVHFTIIAQMELKRSLNSIAQKKYVSYVYVIVVVTIHT